MDGTRNAGSIIHITYCLHVNVCVTADTVLSDKSSSVFLAIFLSSTLL